MRIPDFPARAAALLLMVFSASPTAAQEKDGDGFVPMFNGKDLSGWVNINGAPETWSMKEDGTVHCTGKPICALRTERKYENFILEVEWRHLKPKGNAGIFIWAASRSAQGQPFLRAIEVQVLENAYGKSNSFTTHGDVFPIHGSTMKPFPPNNGMRSFPTEDRSKPSPAWNHYRIVCQDGVLRLHVNGKEVSGGENCNYRNGFIALESEGSPVEFRKMRIKELPGGKATADQTAPDFDGFVSVYNGVDFRGWEKPGSQWKSADWKIRAGGTDAGQRLVSAKSYGDIQLQFDWRWAGDSRVLKDEPDKAKASVDLRGSAAARMKLTQDGSALPPGRWNRTLLTIKGNQMDIETNGKKSGARTVTGAPAAGPISFAVGGVPVEFANIYVREAKPRPE